MTYRRLIHELACLTDEQRDMKVIASLGDRPCFTIDEVRRITVDLYLDSKGKAMPSGDTKSTTLVYKAGQTFLYCGIDKEATNG